VSRRVGEVAVVVAIVAIAVWLRVVHRGTPSLWWDELVEIRTAELPLVSLLQRVRGGLIFGSGTAGAMPTDYVVLHAFLRATAAPAPTALEAHFRAPACAASVASVAALYLLGRALYGRPTGALAAWLLALSMPAILYAAEARSYSLLTLATVLQVGAFASVVAQPARAPRWALYGLASVLYFLTGVFGLLVIGVQYAVLAVVALGGGARRPRPIVLGANGLVLAALVAAYFAGTPFAATYPRTAVVEPLATTWASLRFLAADSRVLVAVFLVAIPLAVRAGARRGRAAVAWSIVLAFATLPLIALTIASRHYYFHGRHVVFLLPLFELIVAAGVIEGLRLVDPLRRFVGAPRRRRILEASAAGLLALALVLPDLRVFVADPHWHFSRTKTVRDLAPVVRAVAAHVAGLPPGERYLLVAERNSTANAMLSAYLGWYGLTDRVTFRSAAVPLDRVEPILRAHGGNTAALPLRPAHGLYFGFRSLLGLEHPIGEVPPRVSRVGIVGYTTPQAGADVQRFFAVTFREPAAIAPSPPRS
jgi:hypothetical protein